MSTDILITSFHLDDSLQKMLESGQVSRLWKKWTEKPMDSCLGDGQVCLFVCLFVYLFVSGRPGDEDCRSSVCNLGLGGSYQSSHILGRAGNQVKVNKT